MKSSLFYRIICRHLSGVMRIKKAISKNKLVLVFNEFKKYVEDISEIKKRILFISLFLSQTGIKSCTKIIKINPPTSTITSSQVFADSADAASAISGIYNSMINANTTSFGNGAITVYYGSSSDELIPYNNGAINLQLNTNTVLSTNTNTSSIWLQAYPILYQVNAVIEGLQTSTGISQSVKNEFTGEAKFFRAFIDFYLVNSYGEIPLLNSTDYQSNSLAYRSSTADVYQSIIADLMDAQELLPADFSAGSGERIRANKFAATALLARVYLYNGKYSDAETQSTNIINNTTYYSLVSNVNNVFQKNSTEAILQFQIKSNLPTINHNATPEGFEFVPYSPTSSPFYYLSPELLSAFESGDLRRTFWVDSTIYSGVIYYVPYKYIVGPGQASPNGNVSQYYMVLRLAEQYLIRAEAEAQLNDLSDAINDLNAIRLRANLTSLPISSLTRVQVLAAVAQERRIELFSEWGHRWLDLIRTGMTGTTFSSIPYKSAYASFQQLYPIPPGELKSDPNLTQNAGY